MLRLRDLALASLLVAACTESRDNAIRVGEYNAMSGPQATFGESAHSGIMMAIDEVNSAGGIGGRPVRIILEDDQSRPEVAVNAVSKLISQDGVVALLGEVASSTTLAAAPMAQRSKVPMISTSSTNPAVTKVGDYIFRMTFTDPQQGEAIGNYIARDLGMKRAALLVDVRSDYSTGLAEFFEKTFVANGGVIVARHSYAEGDNDFRSQLTAIRGAEPDVIFVPGYYNDVSQIAIQARELGIRQPLAGGDGWESPKLIELGGEAMEGSFYANSYFARDPDPRVRDFVRRYELRYGSTPDALAALGYDAANVLADAMRRAKSLEGPAIRDAIAATRDFRGITGNITYGGQRDPIGKKIVIVEVANGALTLKDSVER